MADVLKRGSNLRFAIMATEAEDEISRANIASLHAPFTGETDAVIILIEAEDRMS